MRRALTLVIGLSLLPPAAAGDRDGDSPAVEPAISPADRITPEHQAAIDRGLEFLKSKQEVDGGFSTTPEGESRSRGADYKTAVTALSTLAFLGAGHGLRQGPYRKQVRDGVEWLLRAQEESSIPGYIAKSSDNQSRMHGHGFATLALAEAYGTASPTEDLSSGPARSESDRVFSKRLHDAIQSAVRLIEDSQSTTGGWDYVPSSGGTGDHEGSVTVCEVQALLAAGNRGFRVDLGRIQKARRYMKDSQAKGGGFKYRLSQEDSPQYSWALTAAGVVSLLGLTEFDRKEAIDAGIKYMESRNRRPWSDGQYRFYGSFYAVQAYHWLGGERWAQFWIPFRSKLIGQQQGDGRWNGHDTQIDFGEAYPTAFTLLTLEVPVGYLSIYAR